MKDRLFVFHPGFEDPHKHPGTKFFCPYSAQVIGFLAYFPQVRDSLELIELGFAKPRKELVVLLGEAHQSAPMLVLGGEPARVEHVHVSHANGHHFIEKTLEILRYLAVTRNVPVPH
jgi:hypothetical protein